MKLLSLQAANFRCFEDIELDLNVDGLVAVVGDNGVGKSTMFAAIEWGLYGGRGRGMLPVRRDRCQVDAECWVEVEFEIGGRAYGVRRVDGTSATLFELPSREEICSGRDTTTREVAVLLGLTKDMFRGTFYARQREVLALDSDNEANRRKQVELLLGIERLRRATMHAQVAVTEQRHLVVAMETGAPDIDALQTEAERLVQDASHEEPIKHAQERVQQARESRQQAKVDLDALRTKEREMIERRNRVETAAIEAGQQRAALESLTDDVEKAAAANAELAELTPIAERIETLGAAEREVDLQRANHERATQLQEREHQALVRAAGFADQLAELARPIDAEHDPDTGGSTNTGPEAEIAAAEAEIEALHEQLRQVSDSAQQIEGRMQQTRDRISRTERAEQIDAQLNGLPDAEQAVDTALAEWHTLTATRTQLDASIKHDIEHRDAVLAGETEAACPMCKRPYDTGELDEILASYERDLAAARERLAELDREITDRQKSVEQMRERAQKLRALEADRRAISDAADADELMTLRSQLETDIALAQHEATNKERCEKRLAELTALLPVLKGKARDARELLTRLASLQAQREQAEREARIAADDLAGIGQDGYDADAHLRVRTELAEARIAGQRCAELRGKADGLDLLRRRLSDQRELAEHAEAQRSQLEAALAEASIEPDAVSIAEAANEVADREVEAAHAALLEANQQATAHSAALAAANARLQDARQQVTQLREQRAELRMRGEVSEALGAFREEASRRARPTLEHETGLLLGQTTRQRYNSVQLTDSYQLQILDGDELHPLRRFSGGEQDLAGLCLRLALSRTLARQRGAETGFVMLDEVFGSQDPNRRRALLEQLRTVADSEFRQVFVISHTGDVVQHCDLRIEVARDESGISTAVGPLR